MLAIDFVATKCVHLPFYYVQNLHDLCVYFHCAASLCGAELVC